MQQRLRSRAIVPSSPFPALASSSWHVVGVWLGLRAFTLLWAALVSPSRPLTDRERMIALWPPSAPLGAWLERVLLAPWQRWDVTYFVHIVDRGYRLDDGTAQFHPLLAWLATPVAWLTGSTLLALMLVSSVASVLLAVVFERLACRDLEPADARTSTLLLLFSPLAFVLFAPYTEALFLLWAVLSLWWARCAAWWWAGLAGGLAVLARQQGIFLVLPLAWELWEASDRDWRKALREWRSWLALLLIPAGLGIWLVFRAYVLGDVRANLSDPQALIYSLLISSSASKVVPFQAFLPPWQALAIALTKMWREPEFSLGVDLVLGGGFIVLLVLAWRNMRLSYRLYAVVITLVSFSYHTGPFFPYMGLPRHLLLAFPVFIGLGPVIRAAWLRTFVVGVGLLGMCFLLLLYVLHGWTP